MSSHRAGPAHRRRHRQPSGRRPATRRRRLVRTLLVLTVALALAGCATAYFLYRDLSGIGSSAALDGNGPRSADGSTNILLMGLDSRKDQNGDDLPSDVLDKLHAGHSDIGGYNANTLILLHVPADGGRATGFSIPRDDLVDIPGHGQDKIKKAYGLAKAEKETALRGQGVTDAHELERRGREAGRRAEIDTVRRFLDVPIDHFAELNLAGFYRLADALGGVEVCLNHPVQDRYSGADFPAGRQTLDGRQALAFVRQRHGLPRGDLDRTRRQQAFLASSLHQLNSLGTLTNPARLLDLRNAAKENVVLDEGWDVLSFLQQATNLSGGKVQFRTLPVERFAKHHGEDVNIVDRDTVRRVLKEALADTAAPAAPAGRGRHGGQDRQEDRQEDRKETPAPAQRTVDGGGVPCVD